MIRIRHIGQYRKIRYIVYPVQINFFCISFKERSMSYYARLHTVTRWVLMIGILIFTACQPASSSSPDAEIPQQTDNFVEKIDDRLDHYLLETSQIETLANGFIWSEGPVWIESQQMLLFSDVPANTIYAWDPEQGNRVFLTPSGFTGEGTPTREPGSNGLALDQQGNLILCQHGNRQVARWDGDWDQPSSIFTPLTDTYQGKKYNSPNDLAITSQGDIYFTDPPYGLAKGIEDPLKEIDYQGVYLRKADGTVKLICDSLSRPNGVALSPDEKTLYVANSDPAQAVWVAFSLNPDGSASKSEVFYDATADTKKAAGLPDGLKVNADGIIFATGPGGVWIFTPEAEVLGKIRTAQASANCAIGNGEGYLYITSDSLLLRVPLQ